MGISGRKIFEILNSTGPLSEVWRWRRWHWYSERRRSTQKVVLPHSGQTKPLGQRKRATASRQAGFGRCHRVVETRPS